MNLFSNASYPSSSLLISSCSPHFTPLFCWSASSPLCWQLTYRHDDAANEHWHMTFKEVKGMLVINMTRLASHLYCINKQVTSKKGKLFLYLFHFFSPLLRNPISGVGTNKCTVWQRQCWMIKIKTKARRINDEKKTHTSEWLKKTWRLSNEPHHLCIN